MDFHAYRGGHVFHSHWNSGMMPLTELTMVNNLLPNGADRWQPRRRTRRHEEPRNVSYLSTRNVMAHEYKNNFGLYNDKMRADAKAVDDIFNVYTQCSFPMNNSTLLSPPNSSIDSASPPLPSISPVESQELKSKFFPHIKIPVSNGESWSNSNKTSSDVTISDNDNNSKLPSNWLSSSKDVVSTGFDVDIIGGPNLVYSSMSFNEMDLRLDCSATLEVLNGCGGDVLHDPALNSLGEGNLRIYLSKNYVTLITFTAMQSRRVLLMGTLFYDLIASSYQANSEQKSITWEGLTSIDPNVNNENMVNTKKPIQLNRYTAVFPKTRIFIHAINVFIECNHASGRLGISKESFLHLTGRDESHLHKLH